jgi:hypothetical protein
MTKRDTGAADTRQPANEIAWRHFWLANVMTDMGRPAPLNAARPERRTRKNALTRRLHRLHYMRATLGAARH